MNNSFLRSVSDEWVIWIDIDEVLAHFLEAYIVYYNEKNNTSFRRNDFFSYRFWEVMWGNKQQAIDSVHDFFETGYFRDIWPVEWSQKAIEKLSGIYDLSIITSRQTILEDETKKWLENNFNWVFNSVHFWNHYGLKWATKTKPEICKELWVKVIIEDSMEYAIECAKNDINVILLNSPWNQTKQMLPTNIIRVKWWDNIVDILK